MKEKYRKMDKTFWKDKIIFLQLSLHFIHKITKWLIHYSTSEAFTCLATSPTHYCVSPHTFLTLIMEKKITKIEVNF